MSNEIIAASAICQTDTPGKGLAMWCVDHDHRTGKVRGLLCNHCNAGLGCLRDDPAVIQSAIDYLKRHQ
jgi:hypothetical protein